MIDDQKEIKGGVSTKNVQGVLPAAGNMARRAHRVLMIAKREAENSEDQAYVNAVRESFNNLNSKVKFETKKMRKKLKIIERKHFRIYGIKKNKKKNK